jgi:hypothetical protein
MSFGKATFQAIGENEQAKHKSTILGALRLYYGRGWRATYTGRAGRHVIAELRQDFETDRSILTWPRSVEPDGGSR